MVVYHFYFVILYFFPFYCATNYKLTITPSILSACQFIDNQYKSMLTFAPVSNSYLLDEWPGNKCTCFSKYRLLPLHTYSRSSLYINNNNNFWNKKATICGMIDLHRVRNSANHARAHIFSWWKPSQIIIFFIAFRVELFKISRHFFATIPCVIQSANIQHPN